MGEKRKGFSWTKRREPFPTHRAGTRGSIPPSSSCVPVPARRARGVARARARKVPGARRARGRARAGLCPNAAARGAAGDAGVVAAPAAERAGCAQGRSGAPGGR